MGMLRQSHAETENQKRIGAKDDGEEVKWKREILQHISTCLFVDNPKMLLATFANENTYLCFIKFQTLYPKHNAFYEKHCLFMKVHIFSYTKANMQQYAAFNV